MDILKQKRFIGEFSQQEAQEFYDQLEVGVTTKCNLVTAVSTKELMKTVDGYIEINDYVDGWKATLVNERQFIAVLTGQLSYHNDLRWW